MKNNTKKIYGLLKGARNERNEFNPRKLVNNGGKVKKKEVWYSKNELSIEKTYIGVKTYSQTMNFQRILSEF